MKGMLNRNVSEEQFLSTLFPNRRVQENEEYIRNYIVISEDKVSNVSLLHQAEANSKWLETCNRLEHFNDIGIYSE